MRVSTGKPSVFHSEDRGLFCCRAGDSFRPPGQPGRTFLSPAARGRPAHAARGVFEMRREIVNRTFVIACALLLAACLPALAQGWQGATLSGRVTDPQGAGLPGAHVTLHERARTQLRLSASTDAAGAYRFERLAPGEYIVEVGARAFAPAAAQAVTVARG